MTGLKVAGAPISWGVCEVPGWGYQLDAGRVLREMRELGLPATEFGPPGFLPDDGREKAAVLGRAGLRAVGGFLPVMLHDPDHDPAREVDVFLDGCLAAGGHVVVLAAYTGRAGYDARPVLDDTGWKTLLANLDRIDEQARDRGVVAALHPHVGTMVELETEVARVVEGSAVGLCVDTGHLLVGGTDPLELARRHADRVVHVHLKDVDTAVAEQVRRGRLTYTEAIPRGLYTPLGEGDVDIARLVGVLRSGGYDGWYVLEQDIMLATPTSEAPLGEGPVAGVRASLDYLLQVAA